MNFNTAKKVFAAGMAAAAILGGAFTAQVQVSYQHIRNATGKLTYNDTTFLIDPMFADKGSFPGFAGTFNQETDNPKTALPESKADIMKGVDAVIVTHTHMDHWDPAAQQYINKDLPVYTQNEQDAEAIRKEGFRNVQVLDGSKTFQGVTMTRIEGQHGTNAMYENRAIGDVLGESMGVVFQEKNEKTTYVMGDTIWNARVTKTLRQYNPEVIVMNTGYAKVLGYNDGIIMGTEDVGHAASLAPKADIITVHMDAINHCTVSRQNMRDYVKLMHLENQVSVPEDGDHVQLKGETRK